MSPARRTKNENEQFSGARNTAPSFIIVLYLRTLDRNDWLILLTECYSGHWWTSKIWSWESPDGSSIQGARVCSSGMFTLLSQAEHLWKQMLYTVNKGIRPSELLIVHQLMAPNVLLTNVLQMFYDIVFFLLHYWNGQAAINKEIEMRKEL